MANNAVSTILLESYLVQTWLDFRHKEPCFPKENEMLFNDEWLEELGRAIVHGREFFEKGLVGKNELVLKMNRGFANERLVKFLLTRWPHLENQKFWKIIIDQDLFDGVESFIGSLNFQNMAPWINRIFERPFNLNAVRCIPFACQALLTSYLVDVEKSGNINLMLELLHNLLGSLTQFSSVPGFADVSMGLFPVLKILETNVFPAWHKLLFDDPTGIKRDANGSIIETDKIKHCKEIRANIEVLMRNLKFISDLCPYFAEIIAKLHLILEGWKANDTTSFYCDEIDLGLTADQIRELNLDSDFRFEDTRASKDNLLDQFKNKKDLLFKNSKINKSVLIQCLSLRDQISAISDGASEDKAFAKLTVITNKICNPYSAVSNYPLFSSLLEISAHYPWLVAYHLLSSAAQQPTLAFSFIKLLSKIDINRCKIYKRNSSYCLDFQPKRPILLDALACALVSTSQSNQYTRNDVHWAEVIKFLLINEKKIHYHHLISEVFFPILSILSTTSPNDQISTMIISIIATLPNSGTRVSVVTLVTCRFFSLICLLTEMTKEIVGDLPYRAIAAVMPMSNLTLGDLSVNELNQVRGQNFMGIVKSLDTTLKPYPQAYQIIIPFITLCNSLA